MTDANPPEVAIISALGIDPQLVQAGSLKILYDGQPDPIITFTLIQRVPMADLAKAMATAIPAETDDVPLGDGCWNEHSPASNENCAVAPAKPTLVPDITDPVVQKEIKARVDAELQRRATEEGE